MNTKFVNKKNDFSILNKIELRTEFIDKLTNIMADTHFILISCVIDKNRLRRNQGINKNPYHLALGLCLDALYSFLEEKKQANLRTHVIVECRGKKEDTELKLAFLEYCSGKNRQNLIMPLEIVFADKKTNAVGLQFADLVARPIGLNYFCPEQKNRAFEVLKNKFYCRDGRKQLGKNYEGFGLKLYPPLDDEPEKAKSPDEPTEARTPAENPQPI